MEPRNERMLATACGSCCKYRLLVWSDPALCTHKCCRRICGSRHVVEIVYVVPVLSISSTLLLLPSLVLPCCRYLLLPFHPLPQPWRPNISSTKTHTERAPIRKLYRTRHTYLQRQAQMWMTTMLCISSTKATPLQTRPRRNLYSGKSIGG